MRKLVFSLVMLPPPVHGASSISKKMLDVFRSSAVYGGHLNLMPSYLAKLHDGLLWKLARFIYTAFFIFPAVIYLSIMKRYAFYYTISGGMGLLFDCIIAIGLIPGRRNIFIHHHSFAYINKKSNLFFLFLKIIGRRRVFHVVLCDDMGAALIGRYSGLIDQKHVVLLSNIAFFGSKSSGVKKTNVKTLGFISNITEDKGIFEFVDLYRKCIESGFNFRAMIAGPCMSSSALDIVRKAELEFPGLKYCGAVYGEKKLDFFESIDILVFPTKYQNEAEPLVIYEAAQHAVPSVAYGRGCIKSMIDRCGGFCVNPKDDFSSVALFFIEKCVDSTFYTECSLAAVAGVKEFGGAQLIGLNDFIDLVSA